MYSFSTCWNSQRHTDGRAMLHEIRALGFDYAELSHGTRISLLPGIIEAVEAGEIKISSLHNFCPLPIGVNHSAPNLYQFSSENRQERESAWRHSLKTLETAARFKAPLVVLHLGSIDMRDYTDRLIEMIQRGQKDTPKYASLLKEAMEKREKKKEKHMQLTCEFLGRLADAAGQHGLKLGVENREGLEEIPLEPDFPFLLLQFSRPEIVYWHDCGHAQIKENLGVINHREHLESMAARLFGFHIHDVQFPGRDHCAPGTGMIDFASLKPMVKAEHIKVFEFSPSLSPEEASAGVAFVKKLWGEE